MNKAYKKFLAELIKQSEDRIKYEQDKIDHFKVILKKL